MKSIFRIAIYLIAGVSIGGTAIAQVSTFKVRIKDVARIDSREKFSLIGYGLVVGLAGTGDSDEELTQRTLANMLQNFNIIVDQENLKAQNAAVVMVTAEIDGAVHRGDTISGSISSIGDAKSLTGGELLLTSLLGTDGESWAVAQGSISTGGFSFGNSGAGGDSVTKNHPTVGTLVNGVKLTRDIGIRIPDSDILSIFLKRPDYTTSVNLAESINATFYGSASVANAATINIRIPREFRVEGRVPEFIREIEQLHFQPDREAKVVFNERTGTIVFGGNIKISEVAISHGSITVQVKNSEGISQPSPFAETGTSERVADQVTTVIEDNAPINLLPEITTVSDLVDILNALGVTPRDIITIFHVLQKSGALHAELVSM